MIVPQSYNHGSFSLLTSSLYFLWILPRLTWHKDSSVHFNSRRDFQSLLPEIPLSLGSFPVYHRVIHLTVITLRPIYFNTKSKMTSVESSYGSLLNSLLRPIKVRITTYSYQYINYILDWGVSFITLCSYLWCWDVIDTIHLSPCPRYKTISVLSILYYLTCTNVECGEKARLVDKVTCYLSLIT